MIGQPTSPPARPAVPDLIAAAVLGVGISLSLSALMLVSTVEHESKLPMPLAVAFGGHLVGRGTLGMRGLLPVGLLLHVGYVSTATVASAAVFRRRLGAVAAFGTALVLWIVAGVTVLPYVGWGLFGAGLGLGGALNVLAVHLLFGTFLWAGSWMTSRGPAVSRASAEVRSATPAGLATTK